MSQENVELVKGLQPTGVDMVEIVGRGDQGPVPQPLENDPDIAAFASDFEVRFLPGTGGGPFAGATYTGVHGLIEGWRNWLAAWASYRVEVEDFIDAGDEVVVLVRVRGRTARDGVSVDHSPAAVWSIREGKIAGPHFYLERHEALEAVGLSE
jgi:ketosteroid isomerase-like protein